MSAFLMRFLISLFARDNRFAQEVYYASLRTIPMGFVQEDLLESSAWKSPGACWCSLGKFSCKFLNFIGVNSAVACLRLGLTGSLHGKIGQQCLFDILQ